MICACGKQAEPGRSECFRCRVSSVGFAFRGGAIVGRDGFHRTKREFLMEHVGHEFEKDIVKNRPDLGKAD